jgi:hypothetical protein
MIVIYRPPPSKTNKLRSSIFFEEFCIFVEQLITLPGSILMAGDFNFHIDNIGDQWRRQGGGKGGQMPSQNYFLRFVVIGKCMAYKL